MSQFNTTELDFEKIRENLIGYFKRNDGPYKDFDFTGSGLSNLIDILAYNTHYNAVNAHMAMNESFLDSAQVRGNVVSRAKLLGYTPKSVTAPSASINITFTRSQESRNVTTLLIPKGTQFITNIDEATYIFETVEDTAQQISADTSEFIFEDLVIKQGTSRVEVYPVDNSYDQRFVINSQKVDTSTLTVEVFPTLDADESQAKRYNLFSDFNDIDANTRLYYVDENADGNFEVRFGNNIFGKRPPPSGLVRLTYLVSDGPVTNGARTFKYKAAQLADVNDGIVTTNSSAAGGAPSETIQSIKYNAPLSFLSQNRAVTSDDYKSLISKNFTGIDTVAAWGGETEKIQQYGKVYVSIKPSSAEFLTPLQKQEIKALLDEKSVIGITPEIVDPDYTYIYYQLFFKYDPAATNASIGGLASAVRQTLINYNATRLNNFEGVYRHSNLLSAVDNTNTAILNSSARVYAYKNIRITANTQDTHQVDFEFQFNGSVSQSASMISSSRLQVQGRGAYLGDEPIAGDNEKRRIYTFITDAQGRELRINSGVGFVYPLTGLVELNDLGNDIDETIKIRVRPAADDIVSERRKILQIDVNETSISGNIDTTSISGSTGLQDYTTFNRD